MRSNGSTIRSIRTTSVLLLTISWSSRPLQIRSATVTTSWMGTATDAGDYLSARIQFPKFLNSNSTCLSFLCEYINPLFSVNGFPNLTAEYTSNVVISCHASLTAQSKHNRDVWDKSTRYFDSKSFRMHLIETKAKENGRWEIKSNRNFKNSNSKWSLFKQVRYFRKLCIKVY